jgi:hypothetical protein
MPSGSYGVALAEQGIPITQASDDQKVLDSRWYTLDILDEPNFSLNVNRTPSGTTDTFITTVYQHNLGYPPAFDYIQNTFTYSGNFFVEAAYYLVSDANNIYLIAGALLANGGYSFVLDIQLRIYTVNITQTYQAPIVQATTVSNNQSVSYGAEFLNGSGGDLSLGQPPAQEIAFSTSMRPLTILQTGTATNAPALAYLPGTIPLPYSTPYPPLFQLAQYFPAIPGVSGSLTNAIYSQISTYPIVGSLSFAGSRSVIANSTIWIGGAQAELTGPFAYILFKDPLSEQTS